MFTAIQHRKRLLFWLIKAYYRKRKKTLFAFFVAGILLAGFFIWVFPFIQPYFKITNSDTIGLVGSYTLENLPESIQEKISIGLTSIAPDGSASPSAAATFTQSTDGKVYTFTLRNDLEWQDGKKVTASDINYNFKDITAKIDGNSKITFTLKDPYSPFPTAVSKPLFKKGLVGIIDTNASSDRGTYKVSGVDVNGTYVSEITLTGVGRRNKDKKITYKFYPNETVAKTAFKLGEVRSVEGLTDVSEFKNWKNVSVTKVTDYHSLVTLFFNTALSEFSNDNKATRQALTYALPHSFGDNVVAYSPLSPNSWAYFPEKKYQQREDPAELTKLAKDMLNTSKASDSASLEVTITTTPRFKDLANQIKLAWENVGIHTNINVTQSIPQDPQILLEKYRIPDDPDQYVLWHSTQSTNITHYSSPKIDKLLEDGRQITIIEDRKDVYANFQKNIIDDTPAAFLYYPTLYTITRN